MKRCRLSLANPPSAKSNSKRTLILCNQSTQGVIFLCFASRLEAITSRLEAVAIRLEAIAIRLEAIATQLEAIATQLEAIASSRFLLLRVSSLFHFFSHVVFLRLSGPPERSTWPPTWRCVVARPGWKSVGQ